MQLMQATYMYNQLIQLQWSIIYFRQTTYLWYAQHFVANQVTLRNVAKLAIFHEILNLDCQATERNIIMWKKLDKVL
jgi:hypothetical protein